MGAVHKQPGCLEMGYDPDREKKEWAVQRFCWGLMFLAAVAALSGVLGDGPASSTREGNVGEELYLEYDRYVRHQMPFAVKVFCNPAEEKDFSLSFTRSYLDKHGIKEIQPEP